MNWRLNGVLSGMISWYKISRDPRNAMGSGKAYINLLHGLDIFATSLSSLRAWVVEL